MCYNFFKAGVRGIIETFIYVTMQKFSPTRQQNDQLITGKHDYTGMESR